MQPVVVITDANLARVKAELTRLLGDHATLIWALDPAQRLAALGLADVLVGPAFSTEMAAAAPRLKLVQVGGAGIDQIDPVAVAEHGRRFPEAAPLQVANTYHHEAAMAEYALWAAIGLRRDLVAVDRALRHGGWRSPVYDPDLPLPLGLAGATVALLGFGHVGNQAWRAFRALGANGIAITGRGAVDAGEHGLAWSGDTSRLPEACEQADVLLVSVPLSDETRGLVDAHVLEALGPRGVLINVARGPVVDEQAAYEALRDHRIAGAALDVWYSYPSRPGETCHPAAAPFAELDSVLITPHISGVAMQTFLGRAADIAHNVRCLAEGAPLRNLVRLAQPATA